YWMTMHTCSGCGGSYWGNALISRTAFTASDNTWACIEVHAKLNADVGSDAGAVLEVWKDDALIQAFPEPTEYAVRVLGPRSLLPGWGRRLAVQLHAHGTRPARQAVPQHHIAEVELVLAAELHHRSGLVQRRVRRHRHSDAPSRLSELSGVALSGSPPA